jgi:hypothetical protein
MATLFNSVGGAQSAAMALPAHDANMMGAISIRMKERFIETSRTAVLANRLSS